MRIGQMGIGQMGKVAMIAMGMGMGMGKGSTDGDGEGHTRNDELL